jgi:hypothetical protein
VYFRGTIEIIGGSDSNFSISSMVLVRVGRNRVDHGFSGHDKPDAMRMTARSGIVAQVKKNPCSVTQKRGQRIEAEWYCLLWLHHSAVRDRGADEKAPGCRYSDLKR